jgi:hypothetical protein
MIIQNLLFMPMQPVRQKKSSIFSGISIECESGDYLAFYDHRSDIIANGDNEGDAKRNLKRMYKLVKKLGDVKESYSSINLPADFKIRKFEEHFM